MWHKLLNEDIIKDGCGAAIHQSRKNRVATKEAKGCSQSAAKPMPYCTRQKKYSRFPSKSYRLFLYTCSNAAREILEEAILVILQTEKHRHTNKRALRHFFLLLRLRLGGGTELPSK